MHGLDYLKDARALFSSQQIHHILRIMGYVKVWASCAWIWFCEGCLYKCLAKKGERKKRPGVEKQTDHCGNKQKVGVGVRHKIHQLNYHLCLVI
jgi:hypothetical protein